MTILTHFTFSTHENQKQYFWQHCYIPLSLLFIALLFRLEIPQIIAKNLRFLQPPSTSMLLQIQRKTETASKNFALHLKKKSYLQKSQKQQQLMTNEGRILQAFSNCNSEAKLQILLVTTTQLLTLDNGTNTLQETQKHFK